MASKKVKRRGPDKGKGGRPKGIVSLDQVDAALDRIVKEIVKARRRMRDFRARVSSI